MSDAVTAPDPGEAVPADARPWSVPSVVGLGVLVALPMAVVITIILALIGLLGWLWAALVGILLGAAIAAFLIVRRMSTAAEVIVAELPPDVRRYDRLDNLVDGLRLTSGVKEPVTHIVDDPAANALAVSRDLEHTIVLTTGLVDSLELVPMEGIVAELMVRLRGGDAERDTLDVALFSVPLIRLPVLDKVTGALASLARGLGASEGDADGDVGDILVDYGAVRLTRYPPGLRVALEEIRAVGAQPAVSDKLDPLWIVDPASAIPGGRSSRPSLDLRIDALAEL